ncbi:MAG: deoxyribonuclease IV [Acidimicrobiales bacterium]|jgi:deoxyribonuclease IV
MLFGAHVSAAGGLLPAIDRAAGMGAEVLQVHTQSPRVWKPNDYSDELLAEFARRVSEHPVVVSTVCHASYLINLGTSDPGLLEKSRACLVRNLEVATRMGAIGLVLHVGSHRGSGFEGVVSKVAAELERALDNAEHLLGGASCRLLMENTAGAGGTIGRSFAELARVLDSTSADERLGICLDTQHLFASGVAYENLDEAEAVVSSLAGEIGLDRLGCLHLNDSKVPVGSNRDRHENLGEGLIGRRALGSLLGHPALQELPVVLEVPGAERKGPGVADLLAAREIHAAGCRRWRNRLRRAIPQPPPAPLPAKDGRKGSRPGRERASSQSPRAQ